MNAKIIKTRIFHLLKYDLKGHLRTHKVNVLSNFSYISFLFEIWSNQNLVWTLKKYYANLHVMKFDLKGHWRKLSKFCKKFREFLPILMKIWVNANIMKTQILQEMKYDLRGHWRSLFQLCIKVSWFFNHFDKNLIECYHYEEANSCKLFIIWSLHNIDLPSYLVMDNVCPCFYYF